MDIVVNSMIFLTNCVFSTFFNCINLYTACLQYLIFKKLSTILLKKTLKCFMIIKECCNHSNTARKANNMNEIINNWDLILNTFKNECDIQNLSFTTFIKPLQVISVSDNEITLLSDTQMSANYVEKRYLKFLEVTISAVSYTHLTLPTT